MGDNQLGGQSEAGTRARRVAVTEIPPPAVDRPDYADAFEIARTQSDERSAETWARDGFERLPTAARRSGLLAHRCILGFRLGPRGSSEHVFGWRIAVSDPDLLLLEAQSRLFSGQMVWRLYESRLVMTTFLRYEMRRTGSAVWSVIGNVHRGGAPHLLRLAATAPGRDETAEPDSGLTTVAEPRDPKRPDRPPGRG